MHERKVIDMDKFKNIGVKARTRASKNGIVVFIACIVMAILFITSNSLTGMQSLGSIVIGDSEGGTPLKFNSASGGSGGVSGVVAAEVPVLLVSLDTEDGPYLSMTNGYEDMITHYGNYIPTSGNMEAELAFLPDKATSNINVNNANDAVKLAWYNNGADHLLLSSDSDTGWQKSIFTKYNGAGNGSDPTGGNGVYRTKINELKAAGKLRDWRSLISDGSKSQSKKLWGSFASVTSAGSSYSWDVAGKIKNYMQLNALDLDNVASWSTDDSNKASTAYMDLLMTLYSCSTETPRNEAQWGAAIDRYINNGFETGTWKCNENIILYPGVAMQVNGGSGDRLVMSCGDAWNYAYHVNTEYSLGLKDVAINKYGKLGLSNVYDRLVKATTDNRNAYPTSALYLNSGNFSYAVNYSFAKKIRLSDWQAENVSNTRKFIESLNMTGKDGTKYYGINIIPSIPMEVTSTSTSNFDIDFDVIWSNKRAKHLVSKGQTVNDVAQLRLNMKVPETDKATWETIFQKYTDFEISFDIKSDAGTGRETRTTKTSGGNTSTLGKPGYQVDGNDYAVNSKVKIDKSRLKSLLWGYTTFDSLYEATTKSQSINLAELQQYGYDLTVTIYYKNATSTGSSVKSNTVGFSKDSTDGERAKHKVTAYREEDPNRKVTYYSDPEAFAEVKQGTVETDGNGSVEEWEAMAGVPSTETLYFTSGGSEFIVELELEFVEGEQAERKYTQTFFGTECEFKRGDQFKPIKATGSSSASGFSNTPTIAKEKFTTDTLGMDTGAITEKDAEWYQGFKPEGAASSVYDLQGHPDTAKKEDGTSVVSGSSYQSDNQPMSSTTLTATWTGLIKNNQGTKSEQAPSSSHIAGYVKGSPAPSCKGGQNGKAGNFNETDTKWDDSKYIEAVKQAEQWAKAYESTNATYTAKKLASGDQNTRIWKVGNATISVSFGGGNSNQGAGSRPAGAYTTGNVGTAYSTQNTNPGYWGHNFSFSYGTDGVAGTHGDSDDGGEPPKTIPHGDDQDGTETVGSTVNAVGDISYTVKVTFDNGTYEAHELCGPCCQHNMSQIFDTWTQKSQYDYARINTMRVYKIHRSYVNDMEEITFVDYNDSEDLKHNSKSEGLIQDLSKGIPWMSGALDEKSKVLSPAEQAKKHTGTDTIVAAISQGDPNIFYNIANEAQYYGDTSGSNRLADKPSRAGRIRYSFQPQEHDDSYLEEICRRGNTTWAAGYNCEEGSRSNKCDGLMRTMSSQNPVIVVGKGHEKPDVTAIAGLYEGALNKESFSNGILYNNYDFGTDQVWMQTLTQAEEPSCSSYSVDGTVEIAGRGKKKQAYSSNTIDDKDYLTEEYHRMRYRRNMLNTMYIVSDMLVLQTSTGDQPVMYYVAPSQTKRLQQHYDYKETDKADNPAGEFRGTLLKNDFKNMWSNNPTCANNWGSNNIGQDGDVNVGSYLGLGADEPDNKFSDTSKHNFQFGTIFDNTGGVTTYGDLDAGSAHILCLTDKYEAFGINATYGANKHKTTDKYVGRQMSGYAPISSVVTPGARTYWSVDNKIDWVKERPGGAGGEGWYDITDSWYIASPSMRYNTNDEKSYYLAGERRKPRAQGLRIFTDELKQDPTNVNKEYITGEAKQTYTLIKDYDTSTNFVHEFDKEDIYAWDSDDKTKVDGFTLDAPYTRNHTKVNDIVIQNPVSTESAAVVHRRDVDGGDYSYDTRADNELAGAQGLKDYIDGLDVCPEVAELCDFRILNCSYDTDKVVFSSNFEATNTVDGKTMDTVYTETGADGIAKTYVVNTTKSNYKYVLPKEFNVVNDKIKYIDTSYDEETGVTTKYDRWLPVFGDTNNDTTNPKGNNSYLKCFGTRWSIPLSDLEVGSYSPNTKLAVEFDFYMPEYKDSGTMVVSFNSYDFYIPANSNKATWNTGNGIEKEVKNTSFIGGRMHLKMLFDFKDATKSELYINNEKLKGEQYRIVGESSPISSGKIGEYLNIGSWNAGNEYGARFYIDNMKITKVAGDRFHTDACYKDIKQHEPAIQYTCQTYQTFTYNKTLKGVPELYIIPNSGRYKVEAYGAQGGGLESQASGSHAGLGGYSYGFTHFDKGQKVLVYPGGSGSLSNGSKTEYFWVLTTGCGSSGAWVAANPETKSNINYINSVTGKQELTATTLNGSWAEYAPTGYECSNHSVSVAIDNGTGKMVSRVAAGGTEGISTASYGYSGGVQTYTAPIAGRYTFEVWGAKGGNDAFAGALGGYAKGQYDLAKGQTVNIYVGGAGVDSASNSGGGWNGGGNAGHTGSSGGGGGASDIRVNGADLGSRVIVAGGGGGGGGGASVGETGGGPTSGNNATLGQGSSHTYPNVDVGGGICTCYHCGNRACGDNYCNNHRYACASDCRVNNPIKGSDGAGGGGGYHGGAARNGDEGGFGGSSYVGKVINGITTAGANTQAYGRALITTPYISTVKHPVTDSAGWNGGGAGGAGGYGGGGATDIRILNYGGVFDLASGMSDDGGTLTFGPYIEAGKGHYQADIYGAGLDKCTFSAYTNAHSATPYTITDMKVSPTHATLYFEVTDNLPAGGNGLEVRVHHTGVDGYRFDKSYISRLEDRIVVGGGGGGSDNSGGGNGDADDGSGGAGGGLIAGNAKVAGVTTVAGKALTTALQAQVDKIKDSNGAWKAIDGISQSGCGLGGGQNYGYALGVGESFSYNTDTGGAGGGYYGGFVTNHNNGGAGGGSGYVGALQGGVSTGNANPKDGFATIHMIEHENTGVVGNKLVSSMDYTGNVQEFTAQVAGNYIFETWGAAGGDGRAVNTTSVMSGSGGKGAYASGTRYLRAGETVYVYVGGKGGSSGVAALAKGSGGWNGGGSGGTELSGETYPESGAGGGGATDVRTTKGGLASRFVVAAGGGGAGDHLSGAAAYGVEGLQTMKKDGKTWARVLYQDISGNTNYFNTSTIYNANQAGMFSCLGQLEKFRGADGKFTFMLEYPDATGSLAGLTNVWKQSSNPVTQQITNEGASGVDAVGFEAINYPMTTPDYGRGIEFNGISSALDGAVGHGNWWLACGIMNTSYAPTNTAAKPYTMPGPISSSGSQGVSKCALWVAVDDGKDASASTGMYVDAYGGDGGAEVGFSNNIYNKGGTQNKVTLGVGANGYSHNGGLNYGSYGGGGGGYYGGYWEGVNTTSVSQGGAGGSSYIGGVAEGLKVAGNGLMSNPRSTATANMTGNSNHGYAKIWLKNESTAGHTSECTFINGLNNKHVHNRNCMSETNRVLVSALNAEWGGDHSLLKSLLGNSLYNKIASPSSIYTFGGFTSTDYKQLQFTDCTVTGVSGGNITVSNFGANVHTALYSTKISASAVQKIIFKVDIKDNPTTVGEVYWVTDKSNVWGTNVQRATYDAINKQYVFDVGANGNWRDAITGVSFDFIADNMRSGKAVISSIDFVGSGGVKTFPETTRLLKSYTGFSPTNTHGIVDGGRGTTSFVGNYLQNSGTGAQHSNYDFKLPININNLQNVKFIRMQVINNTPATYLGVSLTYANTAGYQMASLIPNSNSLQEVVIPINWTGNTSEIWFDTIPDATNAGTLKVASIDFYGYGSLTADEGSTSKDIAANYGYTGGVQTFTVPRDGSYKLEAWGASGGGDATMVGQGGYTVGTTNLTKGQTLYVYTGGQGQYYSNTETSANTPPATFNGGGDGGYGMGSKGWHLGGSGGGATDFRLTDGAWNNITGLRSRILVAGGGGGSGCASSHNPGHGGGLVGVTTRNPSGSYAGASSSGGSQTAGGRGVGNFSATSTVGGFGAGGNAAQCSAGAGGGYYGGGTEYTAGGGGGSSFVTGYSGCDTTYRGQQGGLSFSSVALQQAGNTGNGRARVSYTDSVYAPATVTGANPAIFEVGFTSSIAGLDGTPAGIINAINFIAGFIDEIPYSVAGEYNPIFSCDGLYNAHVCTAACEEETRVLDCQEPHHYGMHYTKATSEHTSCYTPCLDDAKHKANNHQLVDVDGKHIEESIYINTDEYFSIFFPNVGDFYESDLHGIGSTTQTRGMTYEDQMQTSKWTREKYVKFSFDTLFFREETGLWEQYKAYTWIELPVKGEGYPYYNFYCTLNNSELAAAKVEFASEAINAKDTEGKYNYKNWQGLSDEDHDKTNADDFVFKNINGKDTASNHLNNSDNPTEETNKGRKSTLTSLHGAYRKTYVDVVGRIGNLLITDTDDFRWCNMFKTPKNDGTWIVDGIIQEVFEDKQNNYLSWHTNNGALSTDVRNRLVSKEKGMYNTWGTQAWKGSGDTAANALGLPLGSTTSVANNPLSLEKDLLKPGYNVNFEVTTTGNYQQYLQVKPYFYAMCIENNGEHKKGSMYPVDVHMSTDAGYKPINLFGATDDTETWNKYKDSIYDYVLSLNWDEEFVRRNYDATEQAVTENMAKTYKVQDADGEKQIPIPTGKYYALGTSQIVRAEGNARTFIGSEHTIREQFNKATTDDTNFDKLFTATDYQFKAQRWHLKLGVPSSAVFTFYNEDTEERHGALDEITWNTQKMKAHEVISESGKYVIVMTANIKSLGETWNLYYTQADGDNDRSNVTYDNGVVRLGGKNYTFDNYIGPKEVNMNDITIEDLRKRVSARTGKDVNSDTVKSLAQEEFNKIVQERLKAQNRVVIGVYDASTASNVDIDIIGTH